MDEAEIKAAMRKARNAYAREWRRKNPEKVKASQERYWKKRAAEMLSKKAASTEEV